MISFELKDYIIHTLFNNIISIICLTIFCDNTYLQHNCYINMAIE
jgi:hypothetical protein